MKIRSGLCGAIAGAALLAASVHAADASSISPIIISGKHFFYTDNHQEFFFRGVAYQQNYNQETVSFNGDGFTDPLADTAGCKRDIPYLKQLRTNVIRVYAVNPKLDHSDCMNMLAEAGIYVVADLSAPNDSINPKEPTWTTALFARFAAIVDDLSQYNNVIGFFAGNEVVEKSWESYAAPYVKAAVRDTKAYIKQTISRPMYVGYATADVPLRDTLANYFNCGDQDDAVDFWGYNVYSWCDKNSTYVSSHYKARTKFFETYSVPVFFAEYGCDTNPPRYWTDVPVLYGPQMAPVWSGGIAYQYFQTDNQYGLVDVSKGSVSTLIDFTNLKNEIATVTPSSTAMAAINTGTVRECPPTSGGWHAVSSPLPPPANNELCSCVEASLNCVVSDHFATSKYKKEFGIVCGEAKGVCDSIQNVAKSADWGVYSPCSDKQKLSIAMNNFYLTSNKNSQACDFSGAAQLQTPDVSEKCKALLNQVKSHGGGSGSAPEPTSHAKPSGGGGGGSGGGNSAAGVTVPTLDMSVITIGVSVIVAGLTGAGMLVL